MGGTEYYVIYRVEEKQAMKDGRQAFRNGRSSRDCPYDARNQCNLFAAWRNGFAKEKDKRRKSIVAN